MSAGIRTVIGATVVGAVLSAAGTVVAAPDAVGSVEPPRATSAKQTLKQGDGLRLRRVAGDLGDALFATGAPGEKNTLYVVRQSGRVEKLRNGHKVSTFLNLARKITSGGERGLLGFAFHPKYKQNGKIYVDYTNRAGNTVVEELRRINANRARPNGRVLLRVRQPFAHHNGGHVAFGPDGYLYIATGDGGGGDPVGAGQRNSTLLGKILRIDVDKRTGGKPYGIPRGNPFASSPGLPEIYHYGLRNPWRFSFDRTLGDLWIGDVGENAIEEISFARRGRAGLNFGWNAFEGSQPFAGGGGITGPRGHTPPVAQYSHADGCSVTGGYVSRGTGVRALDGRYVFADFCSGNVWSVRAGPNPGGLRQETDRLNVKLSRVSSFGEGNDGTVYVIANGVLYRFAGR